MFTVRTLPLRLQFNYVMPLSKNDHGTLNVFFEETSLVGKDRRRLTFQECKRRLYKRLAFHNIEVKSVKEEEYCYIPMGGELPDLKQRGDEICITVSTCWYNYLVFGPIKLI